MDYNQQRTTYQHLNTTRTKIHVLTARRSAEKNAPWNYTRSSDCAGQRKILIGWTHGCLERREKKAILSHWYARSMTNTNDNLVFFRAITSLWGFGNRTHSHRHGSCKTEPVHQPSTHFPKHIIALKTIKISRAAVHSRNKTNLRRKARLFNTNGIEMTYLKLISTCIFEQRSHRIISQRKGIVYEGYRILCEFLSS